MKSSMHNKFNIQGVSADKRLDHLVRQQKIEHDHVISSHHKEMQDLRNALTIAMDKFSSLFTRCEDEAKEAKEKAERHMNFLSDRMIVNERVISSQKKSIEDMHEHLMRLQAEYARKVDVDKVKRDLGVQIEEVTKSNLSSFQTCQAEFKDLINDLKNDVRKLKSEINDRLGALSEKVDSNFYVSRIDREGVLKEVRIYEKTIFIIEKKIENIYTLIERLNARGEACHKQV